MPRRKSSPAALLQLEGLGRADLGWRHRIGACAAFDVGRLGEMCTAVGVVAERLILALAAATRRHTCLFGDHPTLWGVNTGASCSERVLMDQPTESIPSANLA